MKEFLKSNKIKNKKFLFLLEVVIYLLVEFELVKIEFTQLGRGRGGGGFEHAPVSPPWTTFFIT